MESRINIALLLFAIAIKNETVRACQDDHGRRMRRLEGYFRDILVNHSFRVRLTPRVAYGWLRDAGSFQTFLKEKFAEQKEGEREFS